MKRSAACLSVAIAVLFAACPSTAQDGGPGKRAYGEWRIQIRPDKMVEYERLIESKGLPLFRGAGGRMVGWWKTLVGDLYEHVTIWEYDDMAAFEAAGGKLGPDKAFAEFANQRDPLLAGEQSRFLALAPRAARPKLPETAPITVHEVHRVPWKNREAYLQFMEGEGLSLLRGHGFDPVGPWIVNVGEKTEITYLFRYQSLRQREELLAAFAKHSDASKYHRNVDALTDEVTTRVLVPAPFALPKTAEKASR